MTGKFIGETSMGFVKGRTYDIKSRVRMVYKGNSEMMCICIYDRNSNAWCPYSNLEAVMSNWIIMRG